MPVEVTEDDLRKAVIEVAFVHNVAVDPLDVEVDARVRFANWGEYEKWEGQDEGEEDGG